MSCDGGAGDSGSSRGRPAASAWQHAARRRARAGGRSCGRTRARRPAPAGARNPRPRAPRPALARASAGAPRRQRPGSAPAAPRAGRRRRPRRRDRCLLSRSMSYASGHVKLNSLRMPGRALPWNPGSSSAAAWRSSPRNCDRPACARRARPSHSTSAFGTADLGQPGEIASGAREIAPRIGNLRHVVERLRLAGARLQRHLEIILRCRHVATPARAHPGVRIGAIGQPGTSGFLTAARK